MPPTTLGKILLSKAMFMSIATYPLLSLEPPSWFKTNLESDIQQFTWARDIDIDLEEDGSAHATQWINSSIAQLPKNEGGMAAPTVTNHNKAMLMAWVGKYLDHKDTPWKAVLDLWLHKAMGNFPGTHRGALLTGTPAKVLNTYIHSPVWRTIIQQWYTINKKHKLVAPPIKKIKTFEEVMAQPIWNNPHIPITTAASSTKLGKWGLIAGMQYHTLRDLWDNTNLQWATGNTM